MWNFWDYGYSKIIFIHIVKCFKENFCISSENDFNLFLSTYCPCYLASLCTQVNYYFVIIDLK